MKSLSPALAVAALVAVFISASIHAAPDNSPASSAAELIAKNNLSAAESLLVPLTRGDSKDSVAFFQLGNLRSKQQRLDEAVNAYEHATRLDPTRAEYFSRYATALSGKIQGASFITQAMLAPKMLKAFAKSVELDSNHLPGLIGLARYYGNAPEIAGGSSTKAREYAQRVHALDSYLGEIEFGLIAEREDDFVAALAHFARASALKPASVAAHFSAGRMLAHLGRTSEARQRFDTVLTLAPTHAAAKTAIEQLPPKTAPK